MKKKFVFESMDPSVVFDCRKMENEETRFRAKFPNGAAYIHTEAGEGGWQNAHYHKGLDETFIVEQGWVAVAKRIDSLWGVILYVSRETFVIEKNTPNNIFLPKGAIIHTIQFGTFGSPIGNPDKGDADWWPTTPEFDTWSKGLSLENIADYAGVSVESLT